MGSRLLTAAHEIPEDSYEAGKGAKDNVR
jgi:hypothetical protein